MFANYFNYLWTALLPVLISVLLLDASNLVNMLGGLIMAWSVNQEDWKRFRQSILKLLLINLFTLCACFVLSSVTYVIGAINLLSKEYYDVAGKIVTVAEVLGVIWVAIGKYIQEIWTKLKTLLDITEEEAEIVQTKFEKFKEFKDSEEGIG